jgi:hypothetical protein
MKPHVPSVPSPFSRFVHAWQMPLHAVSQHTPSTQNPLMHCEAAEHGKPTAWSAMHLPVPRSQYDAATQPLSLEHVVAQAVALVHV